METTKLHKVLIGFFVLLLIAVVGWFVWKNIYTPKVSTPYTTGTTAEPSKPFNPNLLSYIEITNGCGPYYDTGTCVNMRLGPGTEYGIVKTLRTGVALQVDSTPAHDKNGRAWYKIIFDKTIRYPERVSGNWYVASDPTSVRLFQDVGVIDLDTTTQRPQTKYILVSISKEMLYAYDGDKLYMQDPVSTGLELTKTSIGTFTVFRKTPSRYMQGPLPGVSDQVYDLPGVPWDLYFTKDGSVIHGAYWHDHFGEPWSHGCVNLSPQEARKLYEWADIGIKVTIVN